MEKNNFVFLTKEITFIFNVATILTIDVIVDVKIY